MGAEGKERRLSRLIRNSSKEEPRLSHHPVGFAVARGMEVTLQEGLPDHEECAFKEEVGYLSESD